MKFCDKENLLILHCDNHLLVVDKAAGMLTQASSDSFAPCEEALDTLAKAWVKQQFQKTGNVFLEPIHRLDKPVSGLVLFARSSKALSRLQEQMRCRTIKKTYYATVEGHPPLQKGRLENYLIHDAFHARIVEKGAEGAKLAVLDYRVVSSTEITSFLEIELYTGRYHQIRAQLAHSGCPILGDAKYGARQVYNREGIALRHGKLSFSHPISKEVVEFTCDVG